MSAPRDDFDSEDCPESWQYHKQIDALRYELINTLDKFQQEWNIHTETMIGVLEDVKLDYWHKTNIEFDIALGSE